MPGLHLIAGPQSANLAAVIPELTAPLHHHGEYRHDCLCADTGAVCFTTTYAGYPLTALNTAEYLVFVEGHVRTDASGDLQTALLELANLLFRDRGTDRGRIARWLRCNHGDYVIAIREKSGGEWAIINDILGRLPLYYSRAADRVIVSREYPLFHQARFSPEFDRLAIAECLWLGFVPGDHTLLQGVRRLPPASVIRVAPAGPGLSVETIYTHCFDHPVAARPFAETADDLVDSFTAACESQASTHSRIVVSLSGGLDSRAVSAALGKSGCPFQAFTFADTSGSTSRDERYARELAAQLQLDWELIPQSAPTGSDIGRMTHAKGGLLSALMAADAHFLDAIASRCGHDTTFLSGDGGDILKPTLDIGGRFRSDEAIVEYIAGRYGQHWLTEVASLTGIRAETLSGRIGERIASYPERQRSRKYTHFVLCDRGMNWNFEGEDRNRGHFFSRTPFYHRPFFERAMACPEPYKVGCRLYRRFLSRLSIEAARVPDASYGLPITSPRYALRQHVIALLRRSPALMDTLRSRLRPTRGLGPDSTVRRYLTQMARESERMACVFDVRALERYLTADTLIPLPALDRILTITALVDMRSGNPLLLGEYADRSFV